MQIWSTPSSNQFHQVFCLKSAVFKAFFVPLETMVGSAPLVKFKGHILLSGMYCLCSSCSIFEIMIMVRQCSLVTAMRLCLLAFVSLVLFGCWAFSNELSIIDSRDVVVVTSRCESIFCCPQDHSLFLYLQELHKLNIEPGLITEPYSKLLVLKISL